MLPLTPSIATFPDDPLGLTTLSSDPAGPLATDTLAHPSFYPHVDFDQSAFLREIHEFTKTHPSWMGGGVEADAEVEINEAGSWLISDEAR